jgi:DNA mismatch repair protein MSH4
MGFHRNIDNRSIAIIDELGRGTSARDGLAIALSIAEALVESKAFVWFATHFRELGSNVLPQYKAMLIIAQPRS